MTYSNCREGARNIKGERITNIFARKEIMNLFVAIVLCPIVFTKIVAWVVFSMYEKMAERKENIERSL